jgi:hypothetical protein
MRSGAVCERRDPTTPTLTVWRGTYMLPYGVETTCQGVLRPPLTMGISPYEMRRMQ